MPPFCSKCGNHVKYHTNIKQGFYKHYDGTKCGKKCRKNVKFLPKFYPKKCFIWKRAKGDINCELMKLHNNCNSPSCPKFTVKKS